MEYSVWGDKILAEVYHYLNTSEPRVKRNLLFLPARYRLGID